MAENESSGRFEELRQRWEQEPSSRIFTQLAEEYRRRGEPMEAVRVLEEGLKHHPASVAAQVSLGRCRLEAGLLEPALAALEAVVRKDPTQMVAYRLLVEAYLQLGDAPSAQERLEIYSQLNPQDPEIETLEERIRHLESAVPPSTVPADAAAEQEEDLSWLTAARSSDATEQIPSPSPGVRPAAPPPPSPAAPLPAAESKPEAGEPTTVEVTRGGAAAAVSSPGTTLLSLAPSSHPTPNLFALVPRPLRRWQRTMTTTGSAEASPLAAPTSAPSVGPEQGGYSLDLDEEAVSEPALEEAPIDDSGPTAEAVETVEAKEAQRAPFDSPQLGESEEIFDRFEIDDEVETPAVVESEMPSFDELDLAVQEGPAAASPPPAAPSETLDPGDTTVRLDVREMRSAGAGAEAAEPAPSPPFEAATPPSPEATEEATVTLGELYRRQGHARDAEQIFRRVLDTDPDNAVARSGLDEITAQRSGPADIASLLGEAAMPETGVTERKAKVLRNYLELLSEGSRDDVP